MSICAIARPSRPARKRYANIMAPLTLLPLACLPATGTLARENTTPTGDEITARTELGRRLFYDIRLAGPGYMSCASCHKPEKTFTDGRPVAIGVTGERHTRNTPTLANVPDLPILGWANPSPQSLEHRMLRPLFSQTPIEMGTRDYEQPVLLHISSNAIYRELFARAFHNDPAPVSFGNITRAITDFQRTIISRDSPYDRYAAGDRDALSPAARRGLALFSSSRTKCRECHVPPLFTVERFHNIGLYNRDGKGGLPGADQGLADETNLDKDIGRFRTPTLRNIAVTGPYMHDGSIDSLEQVIDHYAAGGASTSSGRPSPLRAEHVTGFDIAPDEKRDLIRFLQSLTDRAFLANERLATPFR